MRALLLSRSRVARAITLAAALTLVIFGRTTTTTTTTDDATQVTFTVNATACDFGTAFNFYVGGTLVGTTPVGYSCVCGQNFTTLTVTDPVALALLGAPGCADLRIERTSGGLLLAYARAEVTRSESGVESICIADFYGSTPNGGACADRNLCQGYSFYNYYGMDPGAPNVDTYVSAADTDGDGLADCVDPDIDNDGVLNAVDNCPTVANPGQQDFDHDGIGDACDASSGDIDSDGIGDASDNCPYNYNPDQADTDPLGGNGIGDACENPDRDGDGLLNYLDNCPDVYNPDQADTDPPGGNGRGDACEPPDRDGDGILNSFDNCPDAYNPDQADTDPLGGNGRGDACEPPDRDGDGVLNYADNCPDVFNPDQNDSDANGLGDACTPVVVTVPWLGNSGNSHPVISGTSLVLQGTAIMADGGGVPIVGASWDPGDGTGSIPVADISNSRILEVNHVYAGADGQPYTAVLTVDLGAGIFGTDTFRVIVRNNTFEVQTDMAKDRGLWFLYKTFQRGCGGGGGGGGEAKAHGGVRVHSGVLPMGCWEGSAASTASAAQAFEINNHRETGDWRDDPYVPMVNQALRYVVDSLVPFAISGQPAGNPDTNGDGVGLYSGNQSGDGVYVGGQIVDALVASRTPAALADVGDATHVLGHTYKDIVTNMMDQYWYSQNDGSNGRGGWHYIPTYANDGGGDNSSSQWAAIGGIAAQDIWGVMPPAFAKPENALWTTMSQYHPVDMADNPLDPYNDGRFGYCSCYDGTGQAPLWTDGMSTTPSGLVQLVFQGVPSTDAKFTRGMSYMTKHFTSLIPNDPTLYGMYATTKAMRLAQPPIVDLTDGTTHLDWYGDGTYGIGTYLVNHQGADGHWSGGSGMSTGIGTAFGVIMLSPSLFEQGPIAACSVDSTIVCRAGSPSPCNPTGTDPDAILHFDGSASTQGDNPISSYSWNFQDGSPADPSVMTSHAFTTPGNFGVTLVVTDTKGHTSTVTCPIRVTEQAVPPIADAGGPYSMCLGLGETVVLNGSGSHGRGSNIILYEWDWTTPVNLLAPVDSNAIVPGDMTAYYTAKGPGIYDLALRVTDDSDPAFTATNFTTVRVRRQNDQACPNLPPTANDAAFVTPEDTALAGAVSGSDPNLGPITASVVTAPLHGTLVLNGDGTFLYTPAANYNGPDSFTYVYSDGTFNSPPATVSITVTPVNDPPECRNARPSLTQLWSANHSMASISILGVTDVDDATVSLKVTGIMQDEATHGLNTAPGVDSTPDGSGVGTAIAKVRAERSAVSNGRVYYISFEARDPHEGVCRGTVQVGVPVSQRTGPAVGDGPLFNSTVP